MRTLGRHLLEPTCKRLGLLRHRSPQGRDLQLVTPDPQVPEAVRRAHGADFSQTPLQGGTALGEEVFLLRASKLCALRWDMLAGVAGC
jgi:hypothetical protein